MKKAALFLTLCILTLTMQVMADGRSGRIKWLTNFDEGTQLASKTSKPLILFFTGSDWCTWCIKLEDEVLSTPEFADAVADKFIFVKLDFPLNRQLPQDVSSKNKRLQKLFGVNGFPTLVLLDPQQNQIGTAGYRPGGGKQYASFLLKLLDDNSAFKQKVDNVDKQKVSSAELKLIYDRAVSLNRECDIDKVVNSSLKADQKVFFWLKNTVC